MYDLWTAEQWIERGSASIRQDARAGQRMLKRGLQAWPTCDAAWFNLGIALHQQKKITAAIRSYRQALASDPSDRVQLKAITNLAQDLLLNGDWPEGWALYEQRFRRNTNDFGVYRQLFGEPWQGLEDPRPCHELVVVGEQGFGDTLQFVRLLQCLKDKGLKTRYFGPEPLRPLLETGSSLGPYPFMLERGHERHTLWCPLMSLPERLALTPETIPMAHGYLKPCQKRVELWHSRLRRKPGHRLIAIHWQGNPKFERSTYSQGRSMPFSALQGLAQLANVEFLSIQKGDAAKALLGDHDLSLVEGQADFSATMDFADTAAALANCDLLISSDSGVVHLAGAMGLPVWVALSWVPEWRWGLEATTTPWYQSARLFRPSTPGGWTGVIEAMRERLESLANSQSEGA